MKVTNTSQSCGDALKVLIYGEPGIGKTTLAGTIGEPTLIVSAEAGLLCLAGKDIDVIDISQDDDGNVIPKDMRIDRLGEVYQYLLTKEAKTKYKWIFLDSLTEISQSLIDKLSIEFPEKSQTLALYGENNKRMRSLVKSFRDLPFYSICFTALASQDKDQDNRRYTAIDLVGSFSTKIAGYFDEVFYMHLDQDGNRALLTEKTERVIAKDRSGKLEKIEKADLAKVAAKIRAMEKDKGISGISGKQSGQNLQQGKKNS